MRCVHCGYPLDEGYCLNPHCSMGIYSPVVVENNMAEVDIPLAEIFDRENEDDD